MKTIDFSYFIERYIAGEMSDDERVWFLKETEGNDKLRNEVNLRKRTDEILKSKNIISLRNKLSEIEKVREMRGPSRTSKKHVYLKYAAVFTGLILIGSIILFSERNLNSDKIISRYYKTYEPTGNQRSGKTETNADFAIALDYYNVHDYRNAALYFSKVLDADPGNMQSSFLNGVANFEEKRYPEAKQSFVNVINDNNNLFIETAKWYLALCYINTNEKDKAIRQLEIIKNESSVYRNDAKKIIRKLK